MQHSFVDLSLILLALAAVVGWIWSLYRQRMSEALRSNREEGHARFQAMIEDQTDLICRSDGDGKRLFVNEAYCRFFNRTREELIGTPIGNFSRSLRSDAPYFPTDECCTNATSLELRQTKLAR